MVLDILPVDNFDFTRKIVKIFFGEKLVKILGVLSKLNFWTKIWLFKKGEFFAPKIVNLLDFFIYFTSDFGVKIQISDLASVT